MRNLKLLRERVRFNPQSEVFVKRPQIVDRIRALPVKNATPEAKRRYTENRSEILAAGHRPAPPGNEADFEEDTYLTQALNGVRELGEGIAKNKIAFIGTAIAITGIAMVADFIFGTTLSKADKPKRKSAKKTPKRANTTSKVAKKYIAAGKALTLKVVSTPTKIKTSRKSAPSPKSART